MVPVFSVGMVSVFSDMSLVLGQFSGKHFSAALALPALLVVS